MRNIDEKTVAGFGDEWTRLDQSGLGGAEKSHIFSMYFRIFPFTSESGEWIGFDLGCGSGRWASLVAPQVRQLHVIDASADALQVARRNLADLPNCVFHHASVDSMPLPDRSQDFGYSLGVLHHLPDTGAALQSCARALKPGAPFLLYLYYAFDNRPWWFRSLWRISDWFRRGISKMPYALRYQACQILAALLYWPLARSALVFSRAGFSVSNWPLSFYANRSFYVMRTDALDRFGTRLEQRFSRKEIETLMKNAGFERIRFSDCAPFWCAVGYKRL